MSFEKGDIVMTPGGKGKVVYKRMAASNYSEVAFYSVSLDSSSHNPLYTGSIYPAREVSKAE
jgi:hypothetical protein